MTLSCASNCRARDSKYSPTNLIQFDGLEQCLEIAFAETLITLALDDFEEDRPDDIGGEDLQQHAFIAGAAAVDEYAAAPQLFDVFTVARYARIDAVVVG